MSADEEGEVEIHFWVALVDIYLSDDADARRRAEEHAWRLGDALWERTRPIAEELGVDADEVLQRHYERAVEDREALGLSASDSADAKAVEVALRLMRARRAQGVRPWSEAYPPAREAQIRKRLSRRGDDEVLADFERVCRFERFLDELQRDDQRGATSESAAG